LTVGSPNPDSCLRVDNQDSMGYHDDVGTMILRNVPDELRKQFKLHCIADNTNMTELIINLMRREVEKSKPKK
jgi:hypothetical protein